jgi:DNA modification methylase
VERLMGGEKADMVFTDPPYGMRLDADYSGMVSREGIAGRRHKQIEGDSADFSAKHIFDFFDCEEIILFGADYFSETIPNRNSGSWLVWDKRVEEKYDAVIGSGFELLWSKRKRKRELIRCEYSSWGARMADNIDGIKAHPTMKPVKLLELVLGKTETRHVVDPYLGSGSALIACEKSGRRCYGMEIDPHYCDVILSRWEKYTGKKAELIDG